MTQIPPFSALSLPLSGAAQGWALRRNALVRRSARSVCQVARAVRGDRMPRVRGRPSRVFLGASCAPSIR